ncbi:hypothetical protein FisN_11Lh067 [Fistulifera solaris]|uniref:RING-type domain-containing protein n=1 Tax=Fistulifera solaris TaxID=1519565 RepID=A0A1Z5J7H3_FISSO|nr:hypothetical protein FisN_11Lh067 [Fistulifera solaris]|eukprot:GAX09945.1 hypothetical protein FisN_11Lh067 [Fistulifera solaris]
METMIHSRIGFDRLQALKQKLEKRETCTFMEYAAWIGRSSIIGSMMEGGINPCLRGSLRGITSTNGTCNKELLQIGTEALKKFLLAVPLSLSTHVVQRVVEMRVLELVQGSVCAICDEESQPDDLLCYGSPCFHLYCEICFWKDLLARIFLPSTTKVVICPLCYTPESSSCCATTRSDPQTCYKETLDLYMSLPSGSKDIQTAKKGKGKNRDEAYANESWYEAVAPSLGYTQAIRRDKFFTHIERGSFHFVKGCIDRGIDLNLRNEYGQTALFISAWFGYFDIIQLLLQSGADPSIACNAGITPLQVAIRCNHQQISNLLAECSCGSFTFHEEVFSKPMSIEMSMLIDTTVNHPGAGSFIIDRAIDDAVADKLVALWQMLPVVDSLIKKEMGIPCSVRSYYCDSLGWISSLLADTLRRTLKDKEICVFPRMRFLCYRDKGICLARHVDLNRQHPCQNIRSTHSFLLYLFDCDEGGETTLLQDLSRDEIALTSVKPRKSRLLCFPHACPHKGEETVDLPKLLVRGEVTIV